MLNEQSQANLEDEAAARVRLTLSTLMPFLEPFWNRPLQDYARFLYHTEPLSHSHWVRIEALQRLATCVERAAIRSGASASEAVTVKHQLVTAPVMQTGPHCHLLLEPDAFYTTLFSLLGLRIHRLRWHIWCSASTVKFIESPGKGPGWLRLGADLVNVFGVPRRKMDSYSVCGFGGPYRFQLTGQNGQSPANEEAVHLKAKLPDTAFFSAGVAIKAGNVALWEHAFSSEVNLVQFDDIEVADLCADHLEDPVSFLSTRLFGSGLAAAMLHALNELNAGPWSGWIRQTTDMFWGLADGRIFPLRLRGQFLASDHPRAPKVHFSRECVAEALRGRQLVPNLLTTCLLISILPGVRVLGGCRQTIYYPLMRHVIMRAFTALGEDDLVDELASDRLPGVWGHRVLKPRRNYPLADIGDNEDIVKLLPHFGRQTLSEACGDLESFTRDPAWETLAKDLEAGTIDIASQREWPRAQYA